MLIITQNSPQGFVGGGDIFTRSERGAKKKIRNADTWSLKQEQQKVSIVGDLLGSKQNNHTVKDYKEEYFQRGQIKVKSSKLWCCFVVSNVWPYRHILWRSAH